MYILLSLLFFDRILNEFVNFKEAIKMLYEKLMRFSFPFLLNYLCVLPTHSASTIPSIKSRRTFKIMW